MKTTGLFTLHRFPIRVQKAGVPLRLVFFGDVHRDAPAHAKEKWQEFLRYARTLENAWFVGMGDYVDSASTSERECLGRASLHESTRHDLAELARAKVALLAKELDFMRGRLIGLVGGNHYFAFEDGTTTDNRLCEKLGCKFLGVSSFVRLIFNYFTCEIPFDLWLHHGAGGARLPGGSINRVDQMREFAEADAFAMGHDHKRGVFPANPKLSIHANRDGLSLKSKQQWLLRTGSYLRAYDDGEISYNADAARGPCSLGHVELEITFINTRLNGQLVRRLDVRGIS